MENDTFLMSVPSHCLHTVHTSNPKILAFFSDSSNTTGGEEDSFNKSTDSFQPPRGDGEGDSLEGEEDEKLKEEVQRLSEEEKAFDEMYSRVLELMEKCNLHVLGKTDKLKEETTLIEVETKDVIQERDQALSDLRSVEQAFSDVHRKFERSKLMLENSKVTEGALSQQNEELENFIAEKDQLKEAYKREMEKKMESMYNDYLASLATVEMENARLTATYRRVEMRAESLEAELSHKQMEKSQLNKLTDDLIGRTTSGTM